MLNTDKYWQTCFQVRLWQQTVAYQPITDSSITSAAYVRAPGVMPTWEGPDRQVASSAALPPTAHHFTPLLRTMPARDGWTGELGGVEKIKRRGVVEWVQRRESCGTKGTVEREIYQLFDRRSFGASRRTSRSAQELPLERRAAAPLENCSASESELISGITHAPRR